MLEDSHRLLTTPHTAGEADLGAFVTQRTTIYTNTGVAQMFVRFLHFDLSSFCVIRVCVYVVFTLINPYIYFSSIFFSETH